MNSGVERELKIGLYIYYATQCNQRTLNLFMYCIFLYFIWLAIGLIVLCPVNKKGLHFLQNDRVRGLEIELKRGLYIYECNQRTLV